MKQLPKEFIHTTKEVMGEERFERYLHSFEEETPVSIRLNPIKMQDIKYQMEDAVPWCRNAFYLAKRPNFTFDPLFHAGCYYVQEAASMFLDEVLKTLLRPLPEMEGSNYTQEQLLSTPLPHREGLGVSLDLCAAPGGKSTLLRSALPGDCVLYSNEPIQKRASILLENVTKWGYGNHHVTNLYPRDYKKSKMKFDLILCDVPCSGEGMFRKDEATISEWSPQNVEKCWQLQREIVGDAWACLNDGGILIYSTCTFNTKENEETSAGYSQNLMPRCSPSRPGPNGTSQAPCSKVSMSPSIVSSLASPAARASLCACCEKGSTKTDVKIWYSQYHGLVVRIPSGGIAATKAW